MRSTQYTSAVGSKFHADGSVRPFPGNTIICSVSPQHQPVVYGQALAAQKALQAMQCSDKYAFLPPESFHMTVMELLCDQVRTASNWSDRLPLTASLEQTDRFFIETVLPIPAPDAIRMRYSHMRQPGLIALEPADEATATALGAYRDAVANATGVRFPNHDSYGYHISLVYRLVELTADEQEEVDATFGAIDQRLGEHFGIFEPSDPELVFFDNMFEFVPKNRRHALTTRNL